MFFCGRVVTFLSFAGDLHSFFMAGGIKVAVAPLSACFRMDQLNVIAVVFRRKSHDFVDLSGNDLIIVQNRVESDQYPGFPAIVQEFERS